MTSHSFLSGLVITLIEVEGLLAFEFAQFPKRTSYYTH
jgi:hypothetical protein